MSYSQNFDTGTSFAAIGWAGDTAAAVISANAAALSAPNDVSAAVDGTSARWLYYNTPDANAGDGTTSVTFTSASGAQFLVAVVARAGGGALGTATHYSAQLGNGESPTTRTAIKKSVGGASTDLATFATSSGTFAGAVAYKISLKVIGTALAFRVQRLSDNKYLDPTGPWVTGAIDCLTATDAAIAGSGRGGFLWYNNYATTYRFDDFSSVDAAVPVATGATISGPSAGNSGVASAAFTATPTGGLYTGTLTPSDGGAGGAFAPATLSWTADASAKTYTYTPASVGTKTLSGTASPALTVTGPGAYLSLSPPAASDTPLAVDFGPGYAGLAAVVGLRLFNRDGTVYQARATVASEAAAGSGLYAASVALPGGWEGYVVWDTGGGTPVYAGDKVEYAGRALVARFGPGYGGLTTVGLALTDNAGAVVRARSTTGVVELVAGTGLYALTAAVPAAARQAVWDTGGGSPVYAADAVPAARAAAVGRPIIVGG